MEQNLDKNPNELKEPSSDESSAGSYLNQQDPMNFRPIGKSRKAAVFFIVISLALFSFGIYKMYQNIIGPLKLDVPDWLLAQLNQSEEDNSVEALKQRDTDSDGLTDYQELYQFKTSMFLEDTDSDGASDYDEVNSGEDPMCPAGQSCNLLRLITPDTKLADVIQNISLDPNLTVEQAAVSEFRKFLLDSGLPKEDVDVLTDEDLIAIFQIWQESNIVPEEQWSATTTPEEIRVFLLIQPEADIQAIENLSDEELLELRDKLMAG